MKERLFITPEYTTAKEIKKIRKELHLTQKEFAEMIKTDTAWRNIGAVKEGKVVYLDSSKFGMSANLNVMEALDDLSKMIFE